MGDTVPIYETFAKRKRNAESAGKPVVFRQDVLPEQFRVQVIYIWNDVIDAGGSFSDPFGVDWVAIYWINVHETLAREMGVFSLRATGSTAAEMCKQFLLYSCEIDDVLSLIELSFRGMHSFELREFSRQSVDDAIDELNHRFREHAIGYQFQGGQIISVESQYLHTEAVEPTIQLLHDAKFVGPLEEFMQAHEHFRKGNYKDAIVNAQNAFESTMKAICDQQGWAYVPEKATAQNLLKVLFDNGLIPTEMQSHFTALRSTLESGLPTVRNRGGHGGHGQGADVVDVPDYLAAYCLHLAATNIVLLIEAYNALK